jgi:hypothetical protein
MYIYIIFPCLAATLIRSCYFATFQDVILPKKLKKSKIFSVHCLSVKWVYVRKELSHAQKFKKSVHVNISAIHEIFRARMKQHYWLQVFFFSSANSCLLR